MTIQELQKKYLTIYNSLKIAGFINKITLLLITIPALLSAYHFLDDEYHIHHWNRFMPHSQILLIILVIALVLILIIFTINSFSFINPRNDTSFRWDFKSELFDCAMSEIPEIYDYINNQKIHPKVFYNSGLFKSEYSDYVGDDWIRGHFNEISFEICELHVFNLFKNIFSGIFTRIKIPEDSINIKLSKAQNSAYILAFEAKYAARVLTSQKLNEIFIAIKMDGKFFEADNPRKIESADENILMLKDIVDLIKKITSADTHLS